MGQLRYPDGSHRLMAGRCPDLAAPLGEVWIPVGSPGFSGDAKGRRRSTLDERFGSDGWRYAHVMRGEIVPPSIAILEYEASYRRGCGRCRTRPTALLSGD